MLSPIVFLKRRHWLLLAILLSGCQTTSESGSSPSLSPALAPDSSAAADIPTETVPATVKPVLPVAADTRGETTETSTAATHTSTPAIREDDLWQVIRNGYQLDHHTGERRVEQEINWYRRHPEYIERVTRRAALYLPYIVSELRARELPLELALLPVVESAYDPFAYSHGRAAGLWQFIPGTARLYGVRIDYWYDGRRDVIDSTAAAIKYLTRLHDMFDGDWMLALAAYNAGQGNVMKAIKANRRKGRKTDFWSLSLPAETRAYVPRLFAIANVIANSDAYNLTLAPVAEASSWQVVDIGSQLDLARAARLADMTVLELQRLNPGYNRWATHPDGPHRLLLPREKQQAFVDQLAQLPANERLRWRRHVIANGETLGLIASRYGTSVRAIQQANDIRGHIIVAGKPLMIPLATADSDWPTMAARKADKQSALSSKHGEPRVHKVRSGDSLWTISQRYNVSIRQLARWNSIGTTTPLQIGQTLLIYGGSGTAQAPVASAKVRQLSYRVREGESLALIADRFNVTVASIRRWNDKVTSGKYIQPGDQLTLYVDVTRISD